ncbi:MAG TPA: hypothetical protein VIN57_07545 [Magnetovibrio sp.]
MDISQYTSQSLLGPRSNVLPVRETQPIQPKTQQQSQDAPSADEGGGLFETVLDTVNPLQHLPGVSDVYQSVTGDKSSAFANMAGGFLFGGPMGLAAGAASSFLELVTGKSLLGNAMAFLSGEEETTTATSVAAAQSVAADAREPLGAADQGVSVQQYQAFANASGGINKGIGARATDVGWADNLWTQQTLKQATGSYESNQNLGGSKTTRMERYV